MIADFDKPVRLHERNFPRERRTVALKLLGKLNTPRNFDELRLLTAFALQQVQDDSFAQIFLRQQFDLLHHEEVFAAEGLQKIFHNDAVHSAEFGTGNEQ